MKILLSIIEIIAIVTATIFGILWVKNPNGPYEPILFLILLLGTTIVDVFRRKLANSKTPAPDQSSTNSTSVTNSPETVVQNMVNSPNSVQINSEKIVFQQQSSKIQVEGEWNKIDLSKMIPPTRVSSVGLLFRNELKTGYIKGIVKSDVEGMPGERRFDSSLHDLNPLTININSPYIYLKIEEVENLEHSLQVIMAEAKLIR